jgi:hypothetical protein
MKVAIIYTGALRTIKKTMRYFKQNLLLNQDVDVFACIQNDKSETNEEWEQWLHSELGEHLKSLEWFHPDTHSHFIKLRDLYLLPNLDIDYGVTEYLKNSGSMIEYFQLQLAYIQLIRTERITQVKYDYIIRARTDTIYAKPIDFHWLNWTDDQISTRVQKIKNIMEECKIECTDFNIINYFMNTLLSDNLINNIHKFTGDYFPNLTSKLSLDSLGDYIKNGKYILTFRGNLLYIIRRDLFYVIPALATFYGFQDFFKSDIKSHWWNAELQFQGICFNSNLSIHDYSTRFDEESLYNYDEKKFFDNDFNILNPYMVYCIVRY